MIQCSSVFFRGLDTERRGLPMAEDRFEERFRYERGGEQIRDQTDDQRYRKPADRPGAELKQERRRNEGRDVRIEQRQKDAREPGVDRLTNPSLCLELLFDALEDQH